ncbi:MAG: hypothetical protein IJK52_01465 [Oscillospiraceae bacterium]|nr:hypothetical protein [Oscillospiraceae bacterium]
MSVLFLDAPETKALKSARNYLYAAIFCAFFGAVYERFGHGVYSYFMLYAFAFPLTLGALPAILCGLRGVAPSVSRKLWGAGVAALTVGALFRGVLDIYGTSSALTRVYWVVGVGLLTVARFFGTDRDSGA